jgi:hypothetical protein
VRITTSQTPAILKNVSQDNEGMARVVDAVIAHRQAALHATVGATRRVFDDDTATGAALIRLGKISTFRWPRLSRPLRRRRRLGEVPLAITASLIALLLPTPALSRLRFVPVRPLGSRSLAARHRSGARSGCATGPQSAVFGDRIAKALASPGAATGARVECSIKTAEPQGQR